MAIAFASAGYDDLAEVPRVLARVMGDGVPIVGGTSGACIIGPKGIMSRGVSVVALGGDGLEVCAAGAKIASPELLEAVAPAREIASAADHAATRGLGEFTCLAFAPGIGVDGGALVAAVRKGAGARAQLAGGLTGDELTLDRPQVFVDGHVRRDHLVLAGLFTRRPLGVAARHGWRPVGPKRAITRSEGAWLVSLDDRPALDVWLEDAVAAGATPPAVRGKNLALYLANHYELGLDEGAGEPVVRAPFDTRDDGAVLLAASVPERASARVVHAEKNDMIVAARDAARSATNAAGGPLAGALVLACAGRLAALGDRFADEPREIASEIGAPIGGSCVFGEIARCRRDVEAFHNTTAVVVAIPAA